VNLNPQYFTHGNVLDDEKFRNPPFLVDYQLKSTHLYDIPIDVTVLDQYNYTLSYEVRNKRIKNTFKFGEQVETDEIVATIILNSNWENLVGSDNYFRINSHDALLNYIEENLDVAPLNLEANTFKISFRDNNLFKAHDLVNAIDSIYYNYSLSEKNQANNKKI